MRSRARRFRRSLTSAFVVALVLSACVDGEGSAESIDPVACGAVLADVDLSAMLGQVGEDLKVDVNLRSSSPLAGCNIDHEDGRLLEMRISSTTPQAWETTKELFVERDGTIDLPVADGHGGPTGEGTYFARGVATSDQDDGLYEIVIELDQRDPDRDAMEDVIELLDVASDYVTSFEHRRMQTGA